MCKPPIFAIASLVTGCGSVTSPPPVDGPDPTQTLTVQTSADDGEIDSGMWYPNGEDGGTFAGFWFGAPTYAYFRFVIVSDVPQTAVVIAAELDLFGQSNAQWSSGVSRGLVIASEASNRPPQVIGIADRPDRSTGRALDPITARWPVSGNLTWAIDDTNRSVDLSAVIQQRVKSGGLPAGSELQLWIRGDDFTDNAEISAVDASEGTGRNATLALTWRVAP